MNWDQVAASWPESRGRAREQWARLTDDDLDGINGTYDRLVDSIQRRYGVSRGEAEMQVGDWLEFMAISR